MGCSSDRVQRRYRQAYLAAVRIVRKVPELYENFTGRAKAIFQERNHATILTGLTLVAELARIDPQLIGQFREVRPHVRRALATPERFSPLVVCLLTLALLARPRCTSLPVPRFSRACRTSSGS